MSKDKEIDIFTHQIKVMVDGCMRIVPCNSTGSKFKIEGKHKKISFILPIEIEDKPKPMGDHGDRSDTEMRMGRIKHKMMSTHRKEIKGDL